MIVRRRWRPATGSRCGVADELGARSVAFPAVSAGIYGWPIDDAARIAVRTVSSTATAVDEVTFVLFGPDKKAAFDRQLAELSA